MGPDDALEAAWRTHDKIVDRLRAKLAERDTEITTLRTEVARLSAAPPVSPWRLVTPEEPAVGMRVIGLWERTWKGRREPFDVAIVERSGPAAYDWIEYVDGIDTEADEQKDIAQPTHWMPLPGGDPPPVLQQGSATDAAEVEQEALSLELEGISDELRPRPGEGLRDAVLRVLRERDEARAEVERMKRGSGFSDAEVGYLADLGKLRDKLSRAQDEYREIADWFHTTNGGHAGVMHSVREHTKVHQWLRTEVARLRAVIEGAPHGPGCNANVLHLKLTCRCWKATALRGTDGPA